MIIVLENSGCDADGGGGGAVTACGHKKSV